MKQKTRVCRICKTVFPVGRAMYPWCSIDCQATDGMDKAEKKRKAKKLEAKTEVRVALREFKKNDKPVLLQLAQKLVNQYIRLRDSGNLCISCGHNFANGRVENAGHYVRISKCSFLRFHEDNINLQCSYCNKELDGNEGAYRTPLADKIGLVRLEFLEANKTTLKTWTVEELQEIITTYRKKLKEFT